MSGVSGAVLLVVLATASGGAGDLPPQLRCATPDPTPEAVARCSRTVESFLQQSDVTAGGGVIGVAFHVLRCENRGDLSQAQIEAQIAELNRAFAESGYRFRLDHVDRTDDCRWFHMMPGSEEERSAKETLALDPSHRLNVYTGEPLPFLLGWAYLPDQYPESHFMHGVVLQRSTLPGGTWDGYDQGRTTVHEVGHYLGLYHTFQNGCSFPGDAVEDTPYERTPAFGCPPGRNTCPQPGDDPVGNYMDYGEDRCMVRFSPGQEERMRAMVPAYRPSLIAAPVAGSQEAGAERTAPASSRPEPVSREAGAGRAALSSSTPESAGGSEIETSGGTRAETASGATRAETASIAAARATGELGQTPRPVRLPEVPAAHAVVFEGGTPNPFCDGTVFRFTLPEASWTHLELRAGLGGHVRTLLSRRLEAGLHEVKLDARKLRPGVYQAELTACGSKETRIVVLER